MPFPLSYTALATLSANGQSAAVALGLATEAEVTVYSGATQTWGGGTAVLQQSFDGGTTWFNVPNASWTSGAANTVLGRVPVIGGGLVRISLSGATTPTLNFAIKVEQVNNRPILNFTLTANGSTPVFSLPDGISVLPVTTKTVADNVVAWAAQGTWGGGTLALQVSPDGGTTWFNQQAGLTANGVQYSAGASDMLGRFTLTGATSPSLTIYVVD